MARSNDYSRWFWRDRRNGLYVGLAFSIICSGAIYLAPFFATLRQAPLRIQSRGIHNPTTDANAYSGAIVFVSPDRDTCTRVSFDNNTGKVTGGEQLPCEDAVQDLARRKTEQSATAERLEAISRSLRGEDRR